MSRLKLTRFKAPQPPLDVLAEYLLVYDLKDLHFRLDDLPPITPLSLFGDDQPLIIDLGCGRGDFLITLASEHPGDHFVGFDLHWKSLWDAINKAHRARLHNIKFIRTDFRRVLVKVPDGSAREIYMLFPPPIIQPNRTQEDPLPAGTLRAIHRILIDGGPFHFVTDHPDYFETKLALVEQSGLFRVTATSSAFEGGLTWFQRFWEEKMALESRRFECRKLSAHGHE
jgi:tRNA (guanine-N7-)-methyltransferase